MWQARSGPVQPAQDLFLRPKQLRARCRELLSENTLSVPYRSSALFRRAHGVLLVLDPVPQIAAGIPNRLVRLHISCAVGGANSEGVASGKLRSPREFP